ncbi:MAG: site-2 protease family protein [Leptolyngbyaceae cyanobacterium SM1_3_5]|nr:site-2 protease family protein [Leptolyngbyaceae cyanobacterium SM1_3_5]
MKNYWQIGSVFGIPLLLHTSWFFVLALFTLHFGSSWQQQNWRSSTAWSAGFAMALLLFASVLLHELGHCLVARSQGISVRSITLFLFGGVAAIESESKTPQQAFHVAIAGPAVSFGLCLLLLLLRFLLPLPEPAAIVLETLASINLILALFNMIPGLPLDGGQVLKAAIWQTTGSRQKGVRWAARVGQTLCWIAIAAGITLYFVTSLRAISGLWIALLGYFGIRSANAYRRVANLQDALLRLKAIEVMQRDLQAIDAHLSLNDLATMSPATYRVIENGRERGIIWPEATSGSCVGTAPVTSVMDSIDRLAIVDEATSLRSVVEQLETARRVVVVSAGELVGVIDRGDVVEAIGRALKLPVADSVVDRVRAENVYPPGLELEAIARSVG